MKYAEREGKRICVLRPSDPQSALAHAAKCMRTKKWSNYLGETTYLGYLAYTDDGEFGLIVDDNGELVGKTKPGDVFAAPPEGNTQ